MKKLLLFSIAVSVSACSSPDADEARVDFAGLSEGWNEVVPGGGTACANGDAFSFSFRPGSDEDIAVILPGGGACSSFETCDLEEGTFTPGMDGGNQVDNLTAGIFEFDNPRNPIAEFSVLFVPYCTGDVFLGDQTVTYQNEAGNSHAVPHIGYINTMTALEWMYERVKQPSRIAVMGSSAGAIATPLYAGILADHYPTAEIAQIADGAGAYQGPGVTQSLQLWQGDSLFDDQKWLHPFLTDSTDFVTLYDAASSAFENIRFSQYNTESDSVQVAYVRMSVQNEPDLPDLIRENLVRIESVNPKFRSYTMSGSVHTILGRNELYDDALYPISLVDWISSVIDGKPVESVWAGRE